MRLSSKRGKRNISNARVPAAVEGMKGVSPGWERIHGVNHTGVKSPEGRQEEREKKFQVSMKKKEGQHTHSQRILETVVMKKTNQSTKRARRAAKKNSTHRKWGATAAVRRREIRRRSAWEPEIRRNKADGKEKGVGRMWLSQRRMEKGSKERIIVGGGGLKNGSAETQGKEKVTKS